MASATSTARNKISQSNKPDVTSSGLGHFIASQSSGRQEYAVGRASITVRLSQTCSIPRKSMPALSGSLSHSAVHVDDLGELVPAKLALPSASHVDEYEHKITTEQEGKFEAETHDENAITIVRVQYLLLQSWTCSTEVEEDPRSLTIAPSVSMTCKTLA